MWFCPLENTIFFCTKQIRELDEKLDRELAEWEVEYMRQFEILKKEKTSEAQQQCAALRLQGEETRMSIVDSRVEWEKEFEAQKVQEVEAREQQERIARRKLEESLDQFERHQEMQRTLGYDDASKQVEGM